jgi:23S rRNA (pseudouridine1915-N3)-methyltransferase
LILRLIHPGAAFSGPLDEAACDYQRRLKRHYRVEETLLKAQRLRRQDASSVREALRLEGQRILKAVGPQEHLVALKIEGERWSSESLAEHLQNWMSRGHKACVFVLGSAWGLDDAVTSRANQCWSFGPMTLAHDLARVVFWEQLYRASTIVRHEPYHK